MVLPAQAHPERGLFPPDGLGCAACTREQKHSLILRSKSGIVRLELEELVYCEVMGRTLTFHLNNGVVLESMGRLDDLCDQLVEYPNFLRPHRSFLINMEYIANIAARSITMQDGAVVPLPHGKYSETKDRYLSYILTEAGGHVVNALTVPNGAAWRSLASHSRRRSATSTGRRRTASYWWSAQQPCS